MNSHKLSSTIQKLLDISLCQSYDMGLSIVLRPKFIRFKLFYQPMPSEVIAFFLSACYWHEGYVLCMISLGKSLPWPCWEPQLLGHRQLLFIWRSNVQFYLPPLCLVQSFNQLIVTKSEIFDCGFKLPFNSFRDSDFASTVATSIVHCSWHYLGYNFVKGMYTFYFLSLKI